MRRALPQESLGHALGLGPGPELEVEVYVDVVGRGLGAGLAHGPADGLVQELDGMAPEPGDDREGEGIG